MTELKNIKGSYDQERMAREILDGIIDGCRQSCIYGIIQADADSVTVAFVPYGANSSIEYTIEIRKAPQKDQVYLFVIADNDKYETHFLFTFLEQDAMFYPYDTGKWLPGLLHCWSEAKQAMTRLGGKETVGYSGEQSRRMLKALDGIVNASRHYGCNAMIQFSGTGATVALIPYENEESLEQIEIRPKENDSQEIEFWVEDVDSVQNKYVWRWRGWRDSDHAIAYALAEQILAQNFSWEEFDTRKKVFGTIHDEWIQSTQKKYCPNTGRILRLETLGPMGRFGVGSYEEFVVNAIYQAYNNRKVDNIHKQYQHIVSALLESEARLSDEMIKWAVDIACVVPYGYYPFTKFNTYGPKEWDRNTLKCGIKAAQTYKTCKRKYSFARPEYQSLPEDEKIYDQVWD